MFTVLKLFAGRTKHFLTITTFIHALAFTAITNLTAEAMNDKKTFVAAGVSTVLALSDVHGATPPPAEVFGTPTTAHKWGSKQGGKEPTVALPPLLAADSSYKGYVAVSCL
jgi:hypothetical protein